MSIANDVYVWWFYGLGGLGGWSIFLLLAIGAAAYVYFDSANRNIKAIGWRLGTLLPLILFIPTLLFRFANPIQDFDPAASEWFMVAGVLGAMISIAAAVGYAVSYWGVKPQTNAAAGAVAPPVVVQPPQSPARPVEPARGSQPPRRQPADAWLLDAGNGHRHTLYTGDTRIGRRSSDNDIVLDHPSVSREQALIREQNGVFTIYDRGSSGGTFVNDRRLREPAILYHGDSIDIGEIRLTFVSARS